eukprot:15185027-Alexandrium_andersonii.AAC.2
MRAEAIISSKPDGHDDAPELLMPAHARMSARPPGAWIPGMQKGTTPGPGTSQPHDVIDGLQGVGHWPARPRARAPVSGPVARPSACLLYTSPSPRD